MKTKVIALPDMKKASDRRRLPTSFTVVDKSRVDDLLSLSKGKRYLIKTYGCQANVRDEETMRGMLEKIGYISTEKPENADLIIVNTCAVRENAEDKVYGEIGNLKYLRKKNKNLILGLCGCMVEQPEILDKVLHMFPEVNLFFGTHEIGQLYNLLYEVQTSNERIVYIESKAGEVVEEFPDARNNNYKAFVNIIYGCDKFCTYCIVPYTRGKERSRKFNERCSTYRTYHCHELTYEDRERSSGKPLRCLCP